MQEGGANSKSSCDEDEVEDEMDSDTSKSMELRHPGVAAADKQHFAEVSERSEDAYGKDESLLSRDKINAFDIGRHKVSSCHGSKSLHASPAAALSPTVTDHHYS